MRSIKMAYKYGICVLVLAGLGVMTSSADQACEQVCYTNFIHALKSCGNGANRDRTCIGFMIQEYSACLSSCQAN